MLEDTNSLDGAQLLPLDQFHIDDWQMKLHDLHVKRVIWGDTCFKESLRFDNYGLLKIHNQFACVFSHVFV